MICCHCYYFLFEKQKKKKRHLFAGLLPKCLQWPQLCMVQKQVLGIPGLPCGKQRPLQTESGVQCRYSNTRFSCLNPWVKCPLWKQYLQPFQKLLAVISIPHYSCSTNTFNFLKEIILYYPVHLSEITLLWKDSNHIQEVFWFFFNKRVISVIHLSCMSGFFELK